MDTIWMQFSDEAMTEPCGWSAWQQPIESWPYQAEVALSDARYLAYYDALVPLVQALAPKPLTAS